MTTGHDYTKGTPAWGLALIGLFCIAAFVVGVLPSGEAGPSPSPSPRAPFSMQRIPAPSVGAPHVWRVELKDGSNVFITHDGVAYVPSLGGPK